MSQPEFTIVGGDGELPEAAFRPLALLLIELARREAAEEDADDRHDGAGGNE